MTGLDRLDLIGMVVAIVAGGALGWTVIATAEPEALGRLLAAVVTMFVAVATWLAFTLRAQAEKRHAAGFALMMPLAIAFLLTVGVGGLSSLGPLAPSTPYAWGAIGLAAVGAPYSIWAYRDLVKRLPPKETRRD